MKHIVKRQGHKERFDIRKVYGSCYAACIVAGLTHKEAEQLCVKVNKEIKNWIKEKREVSSTQIFQRMVQCIRKNNREAAYIYETHRDVA